METPESPSLESKLDTHFQTCKLKTNKDFLLEHLINLKNKYPGQNTQSIENAIRECTLFNGNPNLEIKDLISFFEPRDYLHETIFRLSERVSKLENIILQQSMSIQNIEENTTNTNNIVENIDANL